MLTDLKLTNDGTKAGRSESDLAPSHVTLVFNILDELRRDAPSAPLTRQ